MIKKFLSMTLLLSLFSLTILAADKGKDKKKDEKDKPKDIFSSQTFSGLSWREIGPALTSGRIGDLAVHPGNSAIYYVAVASGGVWKTTNAGTTWKPIFDDQGSYSIGCVTLDPQNPNVVWVGSGENNSQRSVGYGDGVYKSVDGGSSWTNMGLKNSEHIGKILVDPRDSNVVYVAAQGPLWSDGGDRGLYKSTDGGTTWTKALEISDKTGVTDIVFDPRNPDVIYAASYQRRRHVWTLINGGPESAIYKSTDAGANWRKLSKGLPSVDTGRIGLAVAPSNGDIVYALIEAAQGKSGFFKSSDRGESWSKQSSYGPSSPQYYQEIFVDPSNPDRIYSDDTFLKVSEDGGKSFQSTNERFKHVDNHVVWIDPANSDHLLVGCDGGIYETFDRTATWHFKANLPVTQFYKVDVDQAEPFYNVYGGTQDNFSLGGPSRTATSHGITNQDWYITLGGDGFQSRIDPTDPNIVYSQYQNGGLARHDRKSGENVFIQPQPGKDEAPLRWNWDAPLIISPHAHTRLYYGANILFRSDDRGNSWRAISGDLTAQIDRNQLEVMGKVWSIEAVSKNASTSFYGNLVALSESPIKEGLIITGSDDGLIQITLDGGQNWRKLDQFPGVPKQTYVNRVEASIHDANTIYAAFNNHKMGDFKPYVLKTTDGGTTWTSIAGNLPERGSVYALVEDHVNPNLLFAGTEFGVFFTIDGGAAWAKLSGGMPVVAARDLAIQRRENDLVVATFGRGFFILDDYSPLRTITRQQLEKESLLLPVKDAWMFIPKVPLGLPGKSFQGDAFYSADNPPFGAIFTYYLPESYKTLEEERLEKEKELAKENAKIPYPTWDELRAEEREEKPTLILTVRDADGNVVRRLKAPASKGFHRIAWDLRYPPSEPTDLTPPNRDNPFVTPPEGPLVAPGTYQVSMDVVARGEIKALGEAQSFKAVPLMNATLPAKDRDQLLAFQQKTARLQRAFLGALSAGTEANDRIKHIKQAILDTPAANPNLYQSAIALENRLRELRTAMTGDRTIASHNEPTPPSLRGRINNIVSWHWYSTSDATQTFHEDYAIVASEFGGLLESLKTLIETDLTALESQLEAAGAPWTPGRIPTWKPE